MSYIADVAAPKTAKEEIVELVLANYKEITGHDPIVSEKYPAGTDLSDFDAARKVLVALANPKDINQILMLAFEETNMGLVGIKSDPYMDGMHGRSDEPLTQESQTILLAEMKRILPAKPVVA